MSIEEHLVENAICELERNKDYNKFMASELLKEQSKQTKIPMSFMWIMAQYVVYTYRESNQRIAELEKQLAIEKLEEVLNFIYGNKWTNIELCVDNSPLKIIRNKLDTMIAELKGEMININLIKQLRFKI